MLQDPVVFAKKSNTKDETFLNDIILLTKNTFISGMAFKENFVSLEIAENCKLTIEEMPKNTSKSYASE